MLPHAGSANDEGGEGGEEEEEEGGDGKDTEEIFEAASAQAAELDRWSVGLIGLALLSGDGGVYRLQEAASPVADLASAFVQALAQPTPAALRSRGRAAGLGEEGTDRGGRQLEASCGGADPSPPGRGCRRVGVWSDLQVFARPVAWMRLPGTDVCSGRSGSVVRWRAPVLVLLVPLCAQRLACLAVVQVKSVATGVIHVLSLALSPSARLPPTLQGLCPKYRRVHLHHQTSTATGMLDRAIFAAGLRHS